MFLKLRFKLPIQKIRATLAMPSVLIYALSFFLPLIVRSIPEIISPMPIGFDTAIYLCQARQLADKPVIVPFFARILGFFYSWGVNLIVFMKVFPVAVYALTIFLAAFYAHRRLGWSAEKMLLLVVVMSLSAPMLRMSWDSHRQSLATVLLLLYINLNPLDNTSARKTAFSALMLSLIGLFHQLALAAATMINFSAALASAKKKHVQNFVIFMLLALFPMLAYESGRLFSGGRVTDYWSVLFEDLTNSSEISHFSIASYAIGILIAAFWYVLPLVPLGFFHNKYLSPWLAIMLFAYLTEIIVPFHAFRMADRWMLYMTVPLLFYATNALDNISKIPKRYNVVCLVVSLVVVTLNGFSMLGLTEPIRSLPSSQYEGFIPSTMVFSTAKPEHVATVLKFAGIINRNSKANTCVVTHEPWFYHWTRYKVNCEVYSFTGYDPQPAISKALEEGHEQVYIIWFEGQVKDAEMIIAENQLGLYQAVPKR